MPEEEHEHDPVMEHDPVTTSSPASPSSHHAGRYHKGTTIDFRYYKKWSEDGRLDLTHFRQQPFKEQVAISRAFLWNPPLLFNPLNDRWHEQWGLVIFVATGVTALVTPLEVAFFPPAKVEFSFLFVLNRLMDSVFLMDIVIQFLTMFPENGRMVKSRSRICFKYLRTWFFLDVIALVPFQHMGLGQLRSARLLRCLRLLKLARMVRGNRALQTWRHRTTVTYAVQDLMQTTMATVCLLHWMACAFGLITDMEYLTLDDPDKHSWVTTLVRDKKLKPVPYSEPMVVYLYALYWTCATVTSVGYGDVCPRNPMEVLVSSILIILGAYFWAYVVGSFCNIVTNLNPHGVQFKQRMDAVNFMLKDQDCPGPLMKRLRAYMNHTVHLQRLKEYDKLRLIFSPQLQKEIAMETSCSPSLVISVPFFRRATRHFMVEVSRSFVPSLFCPCERVYRPSALFILLHGVAVQKGVILPTGNACNLDFVLTCTELQDRCVWIALGFVETFSLERKDLEHVLRGCASVDQKRVRKWICRLACRRGILLEAKRRIAVNAADRARAKTKKAKAEEKVAEANAAEKLNLASSNVDGTTSSTQAATVNGDSGYNLDAKPSGGLNGSVGGEEERRPSNLSTTEEKKDEITQSTDDASPIHRDDEGLRSNPPSSRSSKTQVSTKPGFIGSILKRKSSQIRRDDEDGDGIMLWLDDPLDNAEPSPNKVDDFESLSQQLVRLQDELERQPKILDEMQTEYQSTLERIEGTLQILITGCEEIQPAHHQGQINVVDTEFITNAESITPLQQARALNDAPTHPHTPPGPVWSSSSACSVNSDGSVNL